MKDIAEVDNGRREGDSTHREHCLDVKFHGQHLIGTSNLDRYLHSKLLILILWWLLILLHQVPLAVGEDRPVGSELEPNVKIPKALYVPQGGIKLQVLFEGLWEEKLYLHRLNAAVV